MLKIKNINKNFPSFSLKDISLDIRIGEYLTLLGPSGSGKTVLLEILAGVQKQDDGHIILQNKNISNSLPENRSIGLLYQHYMLFNHMTVFDNITFSLKVKNIPQSDIAMRTNDIAELLQISQLFNRYPYNLSGGEKQRVALARSLIMKPDILLLDEPFTAIDTHLRRKVIEEISRLHKSLGLTIIQVTHDIDEALYLADKIAIIDKGKIIQHGSKETVFKNPKNKFVANFIGYKNIFKGNIENNNHFKTKEVVITLDSKHHNEEKYILIPPESITISNSTSSSTSARNQFNGTITKIIQRNGFYELAIDIGINISAYITHESINNLNLEQNKQCTIAFKATSIKLF
jgi:molybdate/tungstate transport system ATP-binding protein